MQLYVAQPGKVHYMHIFCFDSSRNLCSDLQLFAHPMTTCYKDLGFVKGSIARYIQEEKFGVVFFVDIFGQR